MCFSGSGEAFRRFIFSCLAKAVQELHREQVPSPCFVLRAVGLRHGECPIRLACIAVSPPLGLVASLVVRQLCRLLSAIGACIFVHLRYCMWASGLLLSACFDFQCGCRPSLCECQVLRRLATPEHIMDRGVSSRRYISTGWPLVTSEACRCQCRRSIFGY